MEDQSAVRSPQSRYASKKMRGEPKRFIPPPRPVAPLYDHKRATELSASAYGVVARILDWWWVCGCPEKLPHKYELSQIGRSPGGTWSKSGDVILEILHDIMPGLRKYYTDRMHKRTTLIEIGAHAVAKAKAKRAAEQAQADQAARSTAVLPTYEPRQDTPRPAPPPPEIRQNRPKRKD